MNDTVAVIGDGAILKAAHDVEVKNGYANVIDEGEGLRIIDVGDPSAPVEVGFADTPGSARRAFPAGDRVYVADGAGGLLVLRVLSVP